MNFVTYVLLSHFIHLIIVRLYKRSDIMFWEQFNKLCTEHNTKPNPVAKELGISSGIITKWKNGSLPNSDTLLKIADYFGVSLDYLLGRSELTNVSSIGDIKGSNNTIQNGNNNISGSHDNFFSNIAVSRAYEGLTEREKLTVQMFILDTAAASEKSNATVTEIKKEEASPGWGETSYK